MGSIQSWTRVVRSSLQTPTPFPQHGTLLRKPREPSQHDRMVVSQALPLHLNNKGPLIKVAIGYAAMNNADRPTTRSWHRRGARYVRGIDVTDAILILEMGLGGK